MDIGFIYSVIRSTSCTFMISFQEDMKDYFPRPVLDSLFDSKRRCFAIMESRRLSMRD